MKTRIMAVALVVVGLLGSLAAQAEQVTLLRIVPKGGQPFAYVCNDDTDNVSVIDTATNNVVATIPVGNRPRGVAVSPDGTFVYVTNLSDDTVSVINAATNSVVATIPVGNSPIDVDFTPDGAFAYVTNGRQLGGLFTVSKSTKLIGPKRQSSESPPWFFWRSSGKIALSSCLTAGRGKQERSKSA